MNAPLGVASVNLLAPEDVPVPGAAAPTLSGVAPPKVVLFQPSCAPGAVLVRNTVALVVEPEMSQFAASLNGGLESSVTSSWPVASLISPVSGTSAPTFEFSDA